MSRLEPGRGVLLLSFGGPEGPADVMPFLANVTRGRGVPPERLAAVAEHYYAVGGVSPINDQNRALLAALRAELAERGLDMPLFWGNRNWRPYLADALREAHRAGVTRLLVLTTSAYASYSGCRQYREDLATALAELATEGIELDVDKIGPYFDLPGFAQPVGDAVGAALAELGPGRHQVVFVTHSIPIAMAEGAGRADGAYLREHRAVMAAVMTQVAALREAAGVSEVGEPVAADLVFCSRSGPPAQPWLEPDVNDHLRDLAAAGVTGVVLAPIGFVSDHMEVVNDLDTEAAATAAELGLRLIRVPTVGTDPRFVSGLVDLLVAGVTRACPADCCANPRGARPAACEVVPV